MNQEPNSEAAETDQPTSDPAVDLPRIVRHLTLPEPMDFRTALQALEDGKCAGIKPGENTGFVELWRPPWKRSGYQLRWNRTDDSTGINVEQYLGEWRLVILDHRMFLPNSDYAPPKA